MHGLLGSLLVPLRNDLSQERSGQLLAGVTMSTILAGQLSYDRTQDSFVQCRRNTECHWFLTTIFINISIIEFAIVDSIDVAFQVFLSQNVLG